MGFCVNAMAVLPFDPQTSMCTIDTFGITEGNAEMKAIWTPNIIICDPGTYLPKNQLECVTCVENYWCPGVETTISVINKGINECETGFSVPGATSADECCPYGYSWNGTTCESICQGNEIWDGDMCIETCSAGTIWDYEEKSCVSVCHEELGETWDEESQSCREKCLANEIWEYGIGCHEQCKEGFTWNGEKCANDKCWSNEDWDEVTEQCVPKCKNNMDYDPISGICHEKCPTGQVWDYISGCRPDCGEDGYWNGSVCISTLCGSGKYWNEEEQKCIAKCLVSGTSWDETTNQCVCNNSSLEFDGKTCHEKCDAGYKWDGAGQCVPNDTLVCYDGNFKYESDTEAYCIEDKFRITTTSDTKEFVFHMTARGTFWVDWGDGNVEKIERLDTEPSEYKHTYKTSGRRVIRFGGLANSYRSIYVCNYHFCDNDYVAAIGFGNTINLPGVKETNTYLNVAKIEGSLGAIFPGTPSFAYAFSGCSNLSGKIPDELFDGVNGVTRFMFANTFAGCSKLGTRDGVSTYTIPKTLFAGINGAPQHGIFRNTFNGCYGLKGPIPAELFAGISGQPADFMFEGTFASCSNLNGALPALFKNLNGTYAHHMFASTFASSGIGGPLPDNFFGHIYGQPAGAMFSHTFDGCRSLQGPIPDRLFGELDGQPAPYMFDFVFNYCSAMGGGFPKTLFQGLYGQYAYAMFRNAFRKCIRLVGDLPSGFFGDLYGQPADGMFARTFEGSYNIRRIPEFLFGHIDGSPADGMFMGTFASCGGWGESHYGLQGPLPKLFNEYNDGKRHYRGVVGEPRHWMYAWMFAGCGNLDGEIPEDFFGKISGQPAEEMYTSTFGGCGKLSGKIPEKLFDGIYGQPARGMFGGLFESCHGLTGEIPAGLFKDISGTPAASMYQHTFADCPNLSGRIPTNLFGDIYGKPAPSMFENAFRWSPGLNGFVAPDGTETDYIPMDLYIEIDETNYTPGPMANIFGDTSVAEICPENMYKYDRVFDIDWAPKVSCAPCPEGTYSLAGSTSIAQCCPLGTYWDAKKGRCVAPEYNCVSGKYLHIGKDDKDKICLLESKPESQPTFVVGWGKNKKYYVILSEDENMPINNKSSKKLRVKYNGIIYNAHDDSVDLL